MKSLVSDEDIVIRDCASLEELAECVAVQRAVWRFTDEDLIPVRFFVAFAVREWNWHKARHELQTTS